MLLQSEFCVYVCSMKNKPHNQIKLLFIFILDSENLGIITKTEVKFNPYVKRLILHNKRLNLHNKDGGLHNKRPS